MTDSERPLVPDSKFSRVIISGGLALFVGWAGWVSATAMSAHEIATNNQRTLDERTQALEAIDQDLNLLQQQLSSIEEILVEKL